MKQNGFIATSLLYSFFIVFCAILIAYVGINIHNNNLLNHVEEETRKDLKTKYLGDLEPGSYIRFNATKSPINTSDLKWIIINKTNSNVELLSNTVVNTKGASADINAVINSLSDACFIKKPRILTKNDFYSSVKNNIKTSISKENIANIGMDFIIENNNKYYNYKYNSSNIFSDNNLSEITNINSALVNIRLVITLSSTMPLEGGSGTFYNPYTVSKIQCEENIEAPDINKLLVNKILANGYDNKTNYTVPGQTVATNNEGLRTTKDDYGISYYYRGAVDNNYVVFANMCWRIVRITGNGAIKLVLYNADGKSCTNSGANATMGSDKFNNDYNAKAYMGYMYGSSSSTNYSSMYANINDSTALAKLKTWYDNNLRAYDSKIADVIWCNDKSIYSVKENKSENFGIVGRLYLSPRTPSLICPNDDNGGILSKYTATDLKYGNGALKGYKIGLLTADEIVFAGANQDTGNSNYYLYKKDLIWWTLSPMIFYQGVYTYMTIIDAENKISNRPTSSPAAYRPSIALNKDIKVTGSGTASDPYVVEE